MINPLGVWLLKCSDLNPTDYGICMVMEDQMYQTPVQEVADVRHRSIDACYKALLTVLLV